MAGRLADPPRPATGGLVLVPFLVLRQWHCSLRICPRTGRRRWRRASPLRSKLGRACALPRTSVLQQRRVRLATASPSRRACTPFAHALARGVEQGVCKWSYPGARGSWLHCCRLVAIIVALSERDAGGELALSAWGRGGGCQAAATRSLPPARCAEKDCHRGLIAAASCDSSSGLCRSRLSRRRLGKAEGCHQMGQLAVLMRWLPWMPSWKRLISSSEYPSSKCILFGSCGAFAERVEFDTTTSSRTLGALAQCTTSVNTKTATPLEKQAF